MANAQSYGSLDEQVVVLGQSHLDLVLAGEAAAPAGESAFARRFEQALQRRRLFVIEQGWMGEQEAGPSHQTLQRMATLELYTKANDLSGAFGPHVLTHVPNRVAGVYARRIDLAQRRMALWRSAGNARAVAAGGRAVLLAGR